MSLLRRTASLAVCLLLLYDGSPPRWTSDASTRRRIGVAVAAGAGDAAASASSPEASRLLEAREAGMLGTKTSASSSSSSLRQQHRLQEWFRQSMEWSDLHDHLTVESNGNRRKLPGGSGGGGRGRDDHSGGGPGGENRGGGDGSGQGGGQQGGSSSSRRRHHTSAATSSARGAYGGVHRRHVGRYYTSLGDVLFCLVMALAWTVWLLSSFIKSDLRKYQHESVLVRGHVLHVSVEEDSLGTGIPTYKAIIDYMVPPVTEIPIHPLSTTAGAGMSGRSIVLPQPPPPQSSEGDAAKPGTGTSGAGAGMESPSFHQIVDSRRQGSCDIQIRKQFETSHLLTEGFANVELLVLPHEPTYSVIKEDFDRDFAIHQQHQRSLAAAAAASTGNHPMLIVRSNTMGGISTLSANNNTTAHESMIDVVFDDFEWWRSPWFRRASMAGSGLLVLASVGGAIQVITRLRPSQRCWGWVMVVVGVPLLLPAAVGIHYALRKVRRVFESNSTLIVRGAERLAARPCGGATCEDILDARGPCDEEDTAVLTSPTPATSAADGCYFVLVDKSRKYMTSHLVPNSPGHGAALSPSRLRLSPPGGAVLPTQVELDRESSGGGDHSTQSTSSVSSVSMQERSVR